MSESETKQRIIEAAAALMLEESFHSVGLNQILTAVQVPKGSFYHHFSSKEDLGIEVLRHYAEVDNGNRRRMLLDNEAEENPLLRLCNTCNLLIAKLEESGGKCPCLLQKLASEVSNFSEAMRAELAQGFSDAIEVFQETLDEAVSKELLPKSLDTLAEAQFIIDHWAGAQQRAVISRNTQPLQDAVVVFRERLGVPL